MAELIFLIGDSTIYKCIKDSFVRKDVILVICSMKCAYFSSQSTVVVLDIEVMLKLLKE